MKCPDSYCYMKLLIKCILFSLQWFCENTALDSDDSLEKQKVYKFRGDLFFRQGNYQVFQQVFIIHFIFSEDSCFSTGMLTKDNKF